MHLFQKYFVLFFLPLCLFALSGKATFATGTSYPMTDDTTWNIRFDGPPDGSGSTLSSALAYGAQAVADLNGDGKKDVIVGARRADFNGRVDSGSLYIIYSDLFEELTSTGNVIDLSVPTNYNIRFDGEIAVDEGQRALVVEDFDGDEELDLVFGAYKAPPYLRNNAGSVYVVYNTLLQGITGTGNNLDLADGNSYNLRFDGHTAAVYLGLGNIRSADFDGDQKPDLAMGGKSHVYVVYNTLMDDYSGTGNTIDFATPANYNIRYDGPREFITEYSNTFSANIQDALFVSDLDNDQKPDIIVGNTYGSEPGRPLSGKAYIILNTLIDDHTGTGNIVDLTDSDNWNVSYHGSVEVAWPPPGSILLYSGRLTMFGALTAGDIDNDGKNDLLFAEAASNNSIPFSGSTYVVKNDLFLSHLINPTGNTVDLSEADNWSLRFDGAEENDRHTAGGQIRIADMNNNGQNDLILSAVGDQLNEDRPGKVYVIFDEIFEDASGTGNTFDLADPENWSIRYDGDGESDWLGGSALELVDVNGDNTKDLVVGAWGTDYADVDAGSLYIVYYFPHEFTLDPAPEIKQGERFNITGTVTAPNNPTTIELVQWGHHQSFGDDSGDFFSSWKDCSPVDGAFDSNSEQFTCDHAPLSNDPNSHFHSPHKVFFRARDSKGIYTPVENYVPATYRFSSSGGSSAAVLDRFRPDHSSAGGNDSGEDNNGSRDDGFGNGSGSGSGENGDGDFSALPPYLPDWSLSCFAQLEQDGVHLIPALEKVNAPFQRGQVVKSLLEFFGVELLYPDADPFPDVPLSHVLASHIFTAWSADIISGYADGFFRPWKSVSRAEALKMILVALYGDEELSSLLADVESSTGAGVFTDVSSSDWFSSYVSLAHSLNLVSGYQDGSFLPQNPISPPEFASLLCKVRNL